MEARAAIAMPTLARTVAALAVMLLPRSRLAMLLLIATTAVLVALYLA